jgi:phosphosulfolactate synthase (CoM biosynthesis protein A)
MEKDKRRKKLDGRVDAETIINELMEGVDLDKAAHEDAESEQQIFCTYFGGGCNHRNLRNYARRKRPFSFILCSM